MKNCNACDAYQENRVAECCPDHSEMDDNTLDEVICFEQQHEEYYLHYLDSQWEVYHDLHI